MSTGVLNPENQRQEDAASAGRRLANGDLSVLPGVGSGATAPATTTPTPDTDTDEETPTNGQRNGGSRFRWGNTIGGVLGVAGAYLASNMFGGGWLGTIMFALFAIPAFMMGRSGLGGTLSRWMGESPAEGQEQARGNEVQRAQAQGAPGQQTTQVPAESIAERTQELMLRAQAYANLSQRALDNRAGNRRFTDANVAEVQEQNQQIGRIVQAVQNTTDPVQAERLLTAADQYFNGLYSQPRNQRLRGDMEIEMATLRGSTAAPATPAISAASPASSVNMDPAIAQYYQQTYGRPGTSFANSQVVGSNLSPEAQQQLLAVRQSGQNYQYQPAQPGVVDAQRFSGVPDQQQFAVPDYYTAR